MSIGFRRLEIIASDRILGIPNRLVSVLSGYAIHGNTHTSFNEKEDHWPGNPKLICAKLYKVELETADSLMYALQRFPRMDVYLMFGSSTYIQIVSGALVRNCHLYRQELWINFWPRSEVRTTFDTGLKACREILNWSIK